jgi:hypothetical protein
VLYEYAQIADANHLARQVAEGLALPHDPCDAQLLKLIQQGVSASPHTPPKVERFYRERR